MTRHTVRRVWLSAAQALLGSAGVACLIYAGYRLHLDVATTAMLALIAIVLLSLTGNFVASAVVSVSAALCLHYLFILPHFSMRLADPLDIVALVAFLTTALVITRLLSKVRRSLREVQAASDQLRLAIDTVPALVWTSLPDGSSELNNQRWLDYVGLSREEAREWGYTHAIHPEDYGRMRGKWAEHFATGTVIEDEARLRRHDGMYRWFLHRAVPLRDPAGDIVRWYGTSTDIEDRKQAEGVLREHARLLDLTHDTVFVRDMNDVITYWNRGAEDLYGWTREEAVGQVTHQLLQSAFPIPLEEITATLLRAGRWEGELVHARRDGTRVTVASRWSLHRDENGAPVATLETNNDITERKRAERALRRARERVLKARFAAVLDERTRLAREIHDTLLQGFTGVALKLVALTTRLAGPPETAAALHDVVVLAQKTLGDARRAVWDLRSPSLASGDFPTALGTAAQDCVAGTEVTLEYKVKGPPAPVAPDVEAAVVRVTQEALTNVVKHAAACRVRVSLSFEPRRVRLSVTDDGRGFVVDPDFQAYGGHWGLLGMRERATQVHGRLRVRSSPGQGTEVVLLVPYATR
jgi:PAS domain S-box-containing protein